MELVPHVRLNKNWFQTGDLNLNFESIVAELKTERKRIDAAITALEGMGQNGDQRSWLRTWVRLSLSGEAYHPGQETTFFIDEKALG